MKAVKKAREALGDRAPTFGRGGPRHGGGPGGGGVLGKRRRDGGFESSDDDDIPDEVKKIPMPRDTPPPIPKEILDEWFAKRRARRNANQEPLGEGKGRSEGRSDKPPAAPVVAVESKTVYSAQPIVRDLRKEAVSAFVPSVVQAKIDKSTGRAGLLEPEEADQLEKEGYIKSSTVHTDASSRSVDAPQHGPQAVTMEEVEDQG